MPKIKKQKAEAPAGNENGQPPAIPDQAAGPERKTEPPDPLERFSFPTISVCPRCHGTQTRATSTQAQIQYRKCCAPICGFKYSVRGVLV